MTDGATISSIATAGGTLVLAVATFNSTRSANASARVAERSLLAAQRPVLIPSREDDGIAKLKDGNLYSGSRGQLGVLAGRNPRAR